MFVLSEELQQRLLSMAPIRRRPLATFYQAHYKTPRHSENQPVAPRSRPPVVSITLLDQQPRKSMSLKLGMAISARSIPNRQ